MMKFATVVFPVPEGAERTKSMKKL